MKKKTEIQQKAIGKNIKQTVINYEGIPPELVEKWLSQLSEKDQKIDELAKKYEETWEALESLSIKDKTLKPRVEQAESEFKKGNFDDAFHLYDEIRMQNVAQEAECDYQQGNIRYLQLQYAEAKHWYEEAVRLAPDNDAYLFSLGYVNYYLGLYTDALTYYNQCLALRDKKYPKGNEKIATCLNNLGGVYDSLGQYDKAIGYYEKSLKISLKIYPDENHPSVATRYNNLGGAYNLLGQYNKAIGYFETSLQILREVFPSGIHTYIAMTTENLAFAYLNSGDAKRAQECFRKAEEIKRQLGK